MRELEFLEIIKNKLTDSSLIGDDCAYLEDFDMYITQDTLVEDVHFTKYTIKPYQLGRKAVSVNLSDLAAALAAPKYISVSLSLPKDIKNSYVEEIYRGINDVCTQHGVKVTGGDITGGDKIVISITALGKRHSIFASSRKYAKKDDLIVVTGDFGSSSTGLYALSQFLYCDKELIEKHLNPTPRTEEAKKLANLTDSDIAVMDTSDGLIDALYKTALASKHSMKIDFEKVPVSDKVINFCEKNELNYKDFVKWGGEDYELLICMPENLYSKLNHDEFKCIGTVCNKDNSPSVIINDEGETLRITKEVFEKNSYNHF